MRIDMTGVLLPKRAGPLQKLGATAAALFFLHVGSATGQSVIISTGHSNGLYQAGETILWHVEAPGVTGLKDPSYALKQGGLTVLREGKLPLTNGAAEIEARLHEPGTLLLEVKATGPNGKPVRALAGAAVSPEKIRPAAPRPEDFDAFWQRHLEALTRIPADPQLLPQESGHPGVSYWKITMNNIRGSHIHGQLARPQSGEKLPAMLIVQWAGVYGLPKTSVTDRAASGWLTLNISAHDLPIDESPAFYEQQSQGPLQDYPALGNDDRETSYFLRMYLSCYRAAQYLSERPDWDGKTFLVTGVSQGGLQALVTAALHPKITAAIAGVPAGCDMFGPQAGRSPGWPAWYWKTQDKDPAKVRQASRYYDVVNFASRIQCPVLVGIGLIDETCPPAGIFAALNQIRAPEEIVLLPHSDHHGGNNSQQEFFARAAAWQETLRQGMPAPVKAAVLQSKPPNADGSGAASARRAGVVSHIKVLSDKVADVSSLEAWKKSFVKDGMTDEEKALALWNSSVSFVYQDAPPIEFLHEGCVHDAIKSFNVYGYGMCCCASARLEQLARYVGMEARGHGLNGHSVPEIFWDGQWHMLDASLVNYFRLPDKNIASVSDLTQSVQGWLREHPEYKGNGARLEQFQQANGWTGWKQGPALLANCAYYDPGGWWPARTHGWSSTMQEFDGSHGTPFNYEYGYSQGYEVNIQLRRGERLTRNWFNRGLHVNGILNDGDAPGCLTMKVGEGSMAFLRELGDLTDGRIGSGTHEYDVPLADGAFRDGALSAENLACRNEDQRGPALHLKDPSKQGLLELEMPSSYVYLTGRINLTTIVDHAGQIRLLFSDNNGLDWRPVAVIRRSGEHLLDIGKFVLRRYDYRLRLVIEGATSGLERLKISHDIQCSQRALPTLGAGENTIEFGSGPPEGTITIEGSTQETKPGKQVSLMDFRPVLKDIEPQFFQVKAEGASVSFPIRTPGDMKCLRLGGHYRVRDKRDQWQAQVSFDDGRTFQTVDTVTGPYQGICRYVSVTNVPAGTETALVRWVGTQRNTTCLFLVCIRADYLQPHGGFAPVKVTYVWEENGHEKQDTHIANSAHEVYRITCGARPRMKSIAIQLADD